MNEGVRSRSVTPRPSMYVPQQGDYFTPHREAPKKPLTQKALGKLAAHKHKRTLSDKRGRPHLHLALPAKAQKTDHYIEGMLRWQTDMLMFEYKKDRGQLAPTLPAEYRRLLVPSPCGPEREGVPYHSVFIEEDAASDHTNLFDRTFDRVTALVHAVWHFFRQRMPYAPLPTRELPQ